MAQSQPSPKPPRKQRRHRTSNSPSPDDNAHHGSKAIALPRSSLPTSLPTMATPIRLLVCSIGNPAPYLNTLHSAGHIVLTALAHQLSYPSFIKSRPYGNGLVSTGSEYTLWQSSSLMNVSGPGVAAAWRQFLKETRSSEGEAKLVVVHDELELAPGQVKVKSGSASAKGHNGLKSINEVLRGSGTLYTRICVGIGRPESREPGTVADYVLKKMGRVERERIEGAVGKVEGELRLLRGV